MAKFEPGSIAEYIQQLERLYSDSIPIIKEAVYDGAAVVADEIKKNLNSLPVEEARFATPEDPLTGITQRQKEDLIESFGISGFEGAGGQSALRGSDGTNFINVKLGFDGYGRTHTKKYGWDKTKGRVSELGKLPNVILARSVESGTSFRQKRPFIRPAVNASKLRAENAMEKKILEKIEEIV